MCIVRGAYGGTAMQDAMAEVTRNTPYSALPQLLTVAEAAAVLGTSTWFVYENVKQGHIPHRRIGPKIIQIPKEFFHPDRAMKLVTASSTVAPTVPAKQRLTVAKRRALMSEIAKHVLRETLDRAREVEHGTGAV